MKLNKIKFDPGLEMFCGRVHWRSPWRRSSKQQQQQQQQHHHHPPSPVTSLLHRSASKLFSLFLYILCSLNYSVYYIATETRGKSIAGTLSFSHFISLAAAHQRIQSLSLFLSPLLFFNSLSLFTFHLYPRSRFRARAKRVYPSTPLFSVPRIPAPIFSLYISGKVSNLAEVERAYLFYYYNLFFFFLSSFFLQR